jgi:hypothetical protein
LSSITENAASIPRETPLLNSTENQVQIVESLIADILDKVQAYNLGYALAAGYANTRIRKVVITHQTDGNNYRNHHKRQNCNSRRKRNNIAIGRCFRKKQRKNDI